MNFKNKLISGVFIKRYKRFFVDLQINNKVVTNINPLTTYSVAETYHQKYIFKKNT